MKRKKLGERKRKGKKKRKKEKRHMRWVLPKSMGRKDNQKIRFKKNGMSHTERKMKCREGCEQKAKQNQHRHRKKRREREVKNKKKYCSLPKLNTCRLKGWFSMFTLSQLAKHSSMPPTTPHMLPMGISEKQAEHEEP